MPKPRAVLAALVVTSCLAAPAAAQTVDPALRSDLEQLLEITGAFKNGLQAADLVSSQILDGMKKSQPQVPERAVTILKETLRSEFARAFSATGDVGRDLVTVYARHLTHDDVKGLIAFYRTDLGRKTVSVLPVVMQEAAAVGGKWAAANMPRVLDDVTRQLRSEGLTK